MVNEEHRRESGHGSCSYIDRCVRVCVRVRERERGNWLLVKKMVAARFELGLMEDKSAFIFPFLFSFFLFVNS